MEEMEKNVEKTQVAAEPGEAETETDLLLQPCISLRMPCRCSVPMHRRSPPPFAPAGLRLENESGLTRGAPSRVDEGDAVGNGHSTRAAGTAPSVAH